MAFLVDTNVLSELRKGARCDSKVRQWAISTMHACHCLSVLSLGEIRKGIELLRRKSPAQCPAFERWLGQLLRDYDQEVLPVTEAISDRWGNMMATQTIPVIDGLIAATAIEHGLTVVTRNTHDFLSSGVPLLNPFL